ncbi:Beta-1,3-galactosyltransferase bre-2 [Dirofilaria immitis]
MVSFIMKYYNGFRRLKRAFLKRPQIINICCVVVIFCSPILLLHIYMKFSFNAKQAYEATGVILTPYNFTDSRILLTPSFQQCPSVPVFYIIRTHPRNRRWRSIVRSTWAGSLKRSLLFVLGVEKVGEIDELVELEAKKYDDLIVFDMIDTYNNMTLKSLNILSWIVQNCQKPRFFMQGDPDIVAFPDEIASYTLELDANLIAVYGRCWKGAKAHREDSSKWALNSLIYASVTYPTYLAGGSWLFSPATAKRLLMALEKPLSYVHIDDMLISGIFAELMDVRRNST